MSKYEGVCPMLDTDWPMQLSLSKQQITAFCNLGCSPICAELFIKRWGKKLDNKKAARSGNSKATQAKN